MEKQMPSKTLELMIRVPYAHIDKMGIGYYANYFIYFEMARGEMMREGGLPYGELEKRGILLPVVESHCTYKKPAGYDDELKIKTPYIEWRGPILHIEYEVKRGDELIATGYTDHVCMSPEGRPRKPAPELKVLIEKVF